MNRRESGMQRKHKYACMDIYIYIYIYINSQLHIENVAVERIIFQLRDVNGKRQDLLINFLGILDILIFPYSFKYLGISIVSPLNMYIFVLLPPSRKRQS